MNQSTCAHCERRLSHTDMESQPAAAAAVAAEPAAAPAAKAANATDAESPASSPTSSPKAAGAEESKKDYNTTAGVSEVVQKQMDAGMDAAAASAMEYADYLSGQREEGYATQAPQPASPSSLGDRHSHCAGSVSASRGLSS